MYFRQDDDFPYTDDINTTGIEIEPSYKYKPESTQNRPGIFVKRGAVSFDKMGMDDRYEYDPITGKEVFAINAQATWTIFVISKLPAVVDELAQGVYDSLELFAPIVRRDFHFDKFQVVQIGEVGQLSQGESTEFYTVPVVIGGSFNETWTLKPDALKIRNTKITINEKI